MQDKSGVPSVSLNPQSLQPPNVLSPIAGSSSRLDWKLAMLLHSTTRSLGCRCCKVQPLKDAIVGYRGSRRKGPLQGLLWGSGTTGFYNRVPFEGHYRVLYSGPLYGVL